MFKYKEVFIVLALLFIVGCASLQSSRFFNRGDKDVEENPFIGNQGLELSFLEGTPPTDVYRDTTFDIIVDLHNRGALDVTKGTARLNIPLLFEADESSKPIEIISGKENFPGGEVGQVRWEGIKVKKTTVRADTPQKASVQVCYESNVLSQPEVCVRPRPGSDGIIEGECNVGKKTFSGGQGGPISVVSVTENVIKISDTENKIKFIIEVENVGGGDVIDLDEVQDCKLSAEDKRFATVKIEASWLDGELFTCDRTGELIIRDGRKGTISCTSNSVGNDQHYSLPLNIKMNYGYVKSINKGFTLKEDVFFS